MAKLRSSRRHLSLVLTGALLVFLALATSGARAAAPTWGTVKQGTNETDQYQWYDYSPVLGYTVNGPTNILHVAFEDDHDPVFGYPFPYCQPKASCPYRLGIFYEQSTDAGSTWTPKFRLNPTKQQGGRPTLAADGQFVYVGWEAQSSYYDTKVGSGPRVLYIRTNTNYGNPANWNAAIRVTSAKGRVDYPYLYAANGKVFLAWTDSNSGKVFVAVSSDNGATFTKHVVGTTTRAPKDATYGVQGYVGLPGVASTADASTVGVGWLANGKGKVSARISTDGGTTWGAATTLLASGGGKAHSSVSVTGTSGRIGFAWTKGATQGWEKEYDVPGGWQAAHQFMTEPDGGTPSHVCIDQVSLGLQGASTLGVAFGAGRKSCVWGSASTGLDMQYTESTDGGANWSAPVMIHATANPDQQLNSSPDLLWSDSTTRNLMWNSWKFNDFNYQLLFEQGIG